MFHITLKEKDYYVDFQHENHTQDAPGLFETPESSTTCTISIGEEVVNRGKATLCRKDQYCRATGRKVAMTRALKSFPKQVRKEFWATYFKASNKSYVMEPSKKRKRKENAGMV
jgi:beta-mannanase